MRQVPSTITNSKISSYPIAIACKTGTPQRSETYAPGKHYLNAMMVAYLPADDPQIAIGITIEYGATVPNRRSGGGHCQRLLRHAGRHPE